MIAPVSLERVNKRKVRSAVSEPTPNRRPPMFTSDSNNSEWCQSKTFILSNIVSTYDTGLHADWAASGDLLANLDAQIRSSFSRFIFWNQIPLCYSAYSWRNNTSWRSTRRGCRGDLKGVSHS